MRIIAAQAAAAGDALAARIRAAMNKSPEARNVLQWIDDRHGMVDIGLHWHSWTTATAKVRPNIHMEAALRLYGV